MNRTYRYLDGDEERRQLAADISRVRHAVIQLAESVPPTRRYEPRYNGWSLGALMAHLHVVDKLSLWAIQLALLPRAPAVPLPLMERMNDLTARMFQKRVVETTIRGMRANEKRITDLILHLPMDKFSREMIDRTIDSRVTVERALQICFLFHWQEHLMAMQRVEGIFYEPPERYDSM
jgi:hypothetical protein